MILNQSVPQLRRNIGFYMINKILDPNFHGKDTIGKALMVEPSLITQPTAHFEKIMKTLGSYGFSNDQLQRIFYGNTPENGF